MGATRGLRIAACLLAATGLGGCASTLFASRAVTFNLAAEQAQNQVLLLNILRASRRRPLEFTAMQTISGTAEGGVDLGVSLPLTQHHADEPFVVTPDLSFSGRPTYSVSVLDTQEFYQGVMRPLNPQTFDFYLKRDLSPRMLFDLFFSGVTVRTRRDGPAGAKAPYFEAEFVNDVDDDDAFDTYQGLIEVLLRAGLTSEALPSPPTDNGPPLSPDEAIATDAAAKAAAAGQQLQAESWCDLEPSERRDLALRLGRSGRDSDAIDDACDGPAGPDSPALEAALRRISAPGVLYQPVRPAGGPAFSLCFQPSRTLGTGIGRVEIQVTCEGLQHVGSTRAAKRKATALDIDLGNSPRRVCDTINRRLVRGEPLSCSAKVSLEFTFTARSTYEMIRYLGEVVRRQNYPDPGVATRTIMIKSGGRIDASPTIAGQAICTAGSAPGSATADGGQCQPLFSVLTGKTGEPAFVQVDYAGMKTSIPAAPAAGTDRDRTLDAFVLVNELLALNRSAKDVPATTVFTVVGR